MQYIAGLEDVIELLNSEGVIEPVILHTDQGSVYSSDAYNELIQNSVILRSMSRVGTPGDNPMNESLNGWIKEELFMDFYLNSCLDRETVIAVIEGYVAYYNSKRPSWALNYDTPDNYYSRFMNGEIERKETFKNRVLSEIPKGKRKKAESTFKNANEEI